MSYKIKPCTLQLTVTRNLLILHPSPLIILINKLKTKMLIELLAVFLIALLGWAYNFIKPPPPLICGSPGGPPITSPRIKLKDGRCLAYRESRSDKSKWMNRLFGVALVVPAVNYWWPSLPADLSKSVFKKLDIGDQMAFLVAHHLPFLFYGWMKQKLFKPSPTITSEGSRELLSEPDLEIIKQMQSSTQQSDAYKMTRQQGVHESLYRDVMVVFSNWEFDPMHIENPFSNNEGSVHLWAGREDTLCQVEIQRYIAKKLPWIKYH